MHSYQTQSLFDKNVTKAYNHT